MIHTIFLLNQSGEILMEKHWKGVINRSVIDYVHEAQKKQREIPPIIPAQKHLLINVNRCNMFLVAVVDSEVPPLLVVEFLHRVFDILIDYFNECSEITIKENYVLVYELMDEMLDNGYPLATESNILKELIRPPTILRTIANSMTGKSNVSATLPTGTTSNVPWRRSGVKYTNNEAYFDVIEEIDAIIDKSGSIVSAEIQGYIDCCVKLSGIPDLLMSFMNPRLFDDVSFHPCVRFRRWENEQILSFIPPDGNFRLMSYHIGAQNLVSIPVMIRHLIQFKEGSSGKLDISLAPRMTGTKPLEAVSIEIPMPKSVLNVNLTPSQGKYSFDPTTRVMHWLVGRMEVGKPCPSIKGNIILQSGSPVPDSNPTILLKFCVNQLAISGVKVNRLDMFEEKYKPFKGVKYVTRSGNFQIRT